MLIDTCASEVREKMKKKVRSDPLWAFQSTPKYAIMNLKINNFKDNNQQQQKIIPIVFLFYQSRCACKSSSCWENFDEECQYVLYGSDRRKK